MNKTLAQYAETEILSRYETFSKTHRIEPVRSVIVGSVAWAQQCGADENMACIIAAYHEIWDWLSNERTTTSLRRISDDGPAPAPLVHAGTGGDHA